MTSPTAERLQKAGISNLNPALYLLQTIRPSQAPADRPMICYWQMTVLVLLFWKPLTTDTDKWWAVDLGATYSLNRIRLIFPQTITWKYKLEVSGDNSTWQKVIDQSDNAIAGSAFNRKFR